MILTLQSLFWFCLIALACYGLGRALVRGLRVPVEAGLPLSTWSLALGAVTAGWMLTGLGFLGMLYPPLIIVLTFAGCLEAGRRLFAGWEWDDHTPSDGLVDAPPRWLTQLCVLLSLLAAGAALVSALAPATDGDALCYHLELPKVFLGEAALVYLPYSDDSTYPLLVEMWFLWALALDGPVCAQLVHWGAGILLALATVELGRPLVGRWSWIAGSVVLLMPGVTNQMTAPLNDLAVAALTTLSAAAFWRAAVQRDHVHWWLVAGLMLGGAASVKYTALVFIAAGTPALFWILWRNRDDWKPLVAGTAAAMVVAVSISGPWYLRSAWHTGNPVYPYLQNLFGRQGPPAARDSKRPLGRDPLALATVPWQVTMHPDRFGGRAHQFGAVFLALLPGFWIGRRLRGAGLLLSVAAGYVVLWFLLRQNVRFLYPLAPLLGVPAVWVWAEVRRSSRAAAAVVTATTLLLLASSVAISVRRSRLHWPVALGTESRQEWLAAHEPTYVTSLVVSRHLAPHQRLLSQEQRAFYFDCQVIRESIYRRKTDYLTHATSPQQLVERLSDAGIEYLLLADSDGSTRFQSQLSDYVARAEATHSNVPWRCVAERSYRDAAGHTRRYRLVELRPSQVR